MQFISVPMLLFCFCNRRLQFVELDERDDGNAIRYELSQITGRTSVPQIWIGGEFVGGCNDGAFFLVTVARMYFKIRSYRTSTQKT